MNNNLWRPLAIVLMLIGLTACISSGKNKNKDHVTDQLQLQEDIQRFYTRFTERIVESVLQNDQMVYQFRLDALKEYTLYDSEALKITTAPFPVVNLLDMIVFIKLNKAIINSYWIPEVYGKNGEQLLQAFEESEKDINQISHKLLTLEQSGQIEQLVKKWIRDNPHTIRVEKIRFADFSQYAGDTKNKAKSFSLSNLVVNTEKAVQAVDQMVLVANRGIFLAQHMPLIVRLHTRIGTQEIISDSLSTMQSAPQILKELNSTKPLLQDLTHLTAELGHLAQDSQTVLKTLQKSFPKGVDVHRGIDQADSLLEKTTALLRELKTDKKPGHLKEELHQLMWFSALMLILVGICISLAWWTGYYICKRLLVRRAIKSISE